MLAVYGKLYNQDGELVAEGPCEMNDDQRSLTLRPPFPMPMLERQHGTLRLELDDGSELAIQPKVFHFRTNIPGTPANVYRLFLAGQQSAGANQRPAPE